MQQQDGGFQLILLLVLVIIFSYFFIFRPQSKRQKEHKSLLDNLAKGDEILTSGGLIGKITKINNESNTIAIELNADNEVQISRNFVVSVLPKGTMKALKNS